MTPRSAAGTRPRALPSAARIFGATALLRRPCLAASVLLLAWPAWGEAQAPRRSFPYALSTADAWGAPMSLAAAALGRHLRNGMGATDPDAYGRLRTEDVFAPDRWAAGRWSDGWLDASDVWRNSLVLGSGIVAFAPLALEGRWREGMTLAVIFTEAAALTAAMTYTAKALSRRYRPWAYRSDLNPERRQTLDGNHGDARQSFFSGHASSAFAAATLLSTVYQDLHGDTPWARIVWGSSLTLASLTAYARVAGGMHFPTDVVAGAAVGGLIGHLVPRLHRAEGAGTLRIEPTPGGFVVRVRVGRGAAIASPGTNH